MSAAVDKFVQDVESELRGEVVASDPAGIDIGSLIALLLPVLIDAITSMLDGCLVRQAVSDEHIAAKIRKSGAVRSILIRRALRRNECPAEWVNACCEATEKTCDSLSEAESLDLVAEVRNEVTEPVDWSFV